MGWGFVELLWILLPFLLSGFFPTVRALRLQEAKPLQRQWGVVAMCSHFSACHVMPLMMSFFFFFFLGPVIDDPKTKTILLFIFLLGQVFSWQCFLQGLSLSGKFLTKFVPTFRAFLSKPGMHRKFGTFLLFFLVFRTYRYVGVHTGKICLLSRERRQVQRSRRRTHTLE